MNSIRSMRKRHLRRTRDVRIGRTLIAAFLLLSSVFALLGAPAVLADPFPETTAADTAATAEPEIPTEEEPNTAPSPAPEETPAATAEPEATPYVPAEAEDDAEASDDTAVFASVSTTAKFYVAIDDVWNELTPLVVSKSMRLAGQNRFYVTLDEVAERFAAYGFDAESFNGELFFPHSDNQDTSGCVWADAAPQKVTLNGTETWVIPLAQASSRSTENYITFLPNNRVGMPHYFTTKQLRSETVVYNSFYTIRAVQGLMETEIFSELVLNGQSCTVRLPMLDEGTVWTALNPNTDEKVQVTLTEKTDEDGTAYYECVLDPVTQPVLFRSYVEGDTAGAVIYNASLVNNSLLPPVSNEFSVKQIEVVEDGTVRGQATEIVTIGEGESHAVLAPDMTEASVRLLAKGNNRRYLYTFTGWSVALPDGSRATVQPGETLSADQLHEYASEGTVKLTALWSPYTGSGKTIETMNFFISLDCEYSDKVNSNPDSSSFTESLIYSKVITPSTTDFTNQKTTILLEAKADETAYAVNSEIRNTAVSKPGGVSIRDFPSDEYIFEKLRASDKTISVGGVEMDKQYLTTAHFAIRWYTIKYDRGDGFHVDGILVAKSGKLVVTKTFIGDAQYIEQYIKDDFCVTLTKTGESEDESANEVPDYILALKPAGEADSGQTGYTEYDAASNTYTWEISVRQGTQFRVDEVGHTPIDNSDIWQAYHRWMIRNQGSAQTSTGWRDYDSETEGGYPTVTVASYADDMPDSAIQTVALQNIYVKSSRVTVFKSDYHTQNGLGGVQFTITDAGGTALPILRKPGTYIYALNVSGVDTKEFTESVDCITTGNNGYFAIQLAGSNSGGTAAASLGEEGTAAYDSPIDDDPVLTGVYILREVVPEGYYGSSAITLTMDVNGRLTSVSAAEVPGAEEDIEWATINADGMVEITNQSRMLTEVHVTKDWNGTPEDAKLPVTVELYRNGVRLSNTDKQYTQQLSAENGWTYTWTDLPLYADGSTAAYTIHESMIGSVAFDPSEDDGYAHYNVTCDAALYSVGENGETHDEACWMENGTKVFADHILLTVHNSLAGSAFSFTKKNDVGEPLAGAKFTLYADAACTRALETAVSDEDGIVRFSFLRNGTYFFREEEAPPGYGIDLSHYRVVVSDGTAVIHSPTGSEITAIANHTSVELRLEKRNSVGDTLTGAIFELRDGDTVRRIAVNGTAVYIRISKAGNYTLREIKAPSGYAVRTDSFAFSTARGVLTPGADNPADGWAFTAETAEDGTATYTLTVTDTPLFDLPSAGGPGVLPAVLLGTAFMCVSAAMLLRPRRRRRGAHARE